MVLDRLPHPRIHQRRINYPMRNINPSNAIAIVFLICGIGLAVAQPLPREKPIVGPSVVILAPPDATCINWTDDCRACAKSDGLVTCSNVATVCPAERIVRCLKRDESNPSKN